MRVASASSASFACLVNGDSAQQRFLLEELVVVFAANMLQDAHCFASNFCADSVTGHNENV